MPRWSLLRGGDIEPGPDLERRHHFQPVEGSSGIFQSVAAAHRPESTPGVCASPIMLAPTRMRSLWATNHRTRPGSRRNPQQRPRSPKDRAAAVSIEFTGSCRESNRSSIVLAPEPTRCPFFPESRLLPNPVAHNRSPCPILIPMIPSTASPWKRC